MTQEREILNKLVCVPLAVDFAVVVECLEGIDYNVVVVGT